ncbi:hypothetical protein KJ564_04720, partial [bacterium]|nr:hypothetical protein [bacterium]
MRRILITCLVLAFLPTTPQAYWFEYTSLRDKMPIAADPDIYEGYVNAVPLTDGDVLVVYLSEFIGNVYQIIDRYGEFRFPEAQLLSTRPFVEGSTSPCLLSEEDGGAFVVWRVMEEPGAELGMYAQKLDSQGNRLWGDEGILITDYQQSHFNYSTDGMGGLLLVVEDQVYNPMIAFRLGPDGQHLWNENGVVVCDAPGNQTLPAITHDGTGGAYIGWADERGPNYFDCYLQSIDPSGDIRWTPNGINFHPYEIYLVQLIPDGEGGIILHVGNSDYLDTNFAYRVAPDGHVLWVRRNVSYMTEAQIVVGEPGFFYLGYYHYDPNGDGVYAQKMDMDGNFYWPNWNTGDMGAPMCDNFHGMNHGEKPNRYAYQAPYFYG